MGSRFDWWTQLEPVRSRLPPRLWVPVAIAGLLAALWVAILVIPGAWLLLAILIIATPKTVVAAGAFVLLAILFLLWRMHWSASAIFAASLLAVIAAAQLPRPSRSVLRSVANVVEVLKYRTRLQALVIDQVRHGASVRVAGIATDGFVSIANGVAFDATDEIGLAEKQRSASWRAAVKGTELEAEGLYATHVAGHYYVWSHP